MPPSGLDGTDVALLTVAAGFISTTLGLLLTRFGTRKSEAAKQIDQVIAGLQNQIDNLEAENDRKVRDVAILDARVEKRDERIRELEAENRQLAAVDPGAVVAAILSELRSVPPPPALPPAD